MGDKQRSKFWREKMFRKPHLYGVPKAKKKKENISLPTFYMVIHFCIAYQ